MICYGYVPNTVLQPILKPIKDLSDSDSYQPIALAPTLK